MNIPYMASAGWYARRWFGSETRSQTSPLPWNRALVPVPGGAPDAPPLALSVPVCGGSKAVKRRAPEELAVSDHGRWPQVHLGALEAAYGRLPFWRYLQPELAHIITIAPGMKLMEVTRQIDLMLCRFLLPDVVIKGWRQADDRTRERWAEYGLAIADGLTDPSHTFLGHAAALGRDAMFTLLI